jgi:hypothetical protein
VRRFIDGLPGVRLWDTLLRNRVDSTTTILIVTNICRKQTKGEEASSQAPLGTTLLISVAVNVLWEIGCHSFRIGIVRCTAAEAVVYPFAAGRTLNAGD